jgi:hypothetical protein
MYLITVDSYEGEHINDFLKRAEEAWRKEWNKPVITNTVADKDYYSKRKRCPKCKCNSLEITTGGILVGQDTNRATCTNQKCSWKGIVHDLIS